MYKLLQPKENMFVDASVPLQHAESTDAQRRCQKTEKNKRRITFVQRSEVKQHTQIKTVPSHLHHCLQQWECVKK